MIFINRYVNFRNLYLFSLLLMAVSLPLSKYLTSAVQIFLVLVWLAEGKFDEKWRLIKYRPQILVFTLMFMVFLLGMTYSNSFASGINDLKLKIPLFILPLVIGSIKPLNKNEMRIILGGFVFAVIIGCLISFSIMIGIGPAEYTSDRASILFISHIRFALMVVLSIFILFYYVFDKQTPARIKLLLLLLSFSLIIYLFLLKSLTGVVILGIGGMLLALRWGLKQPDLMIRWFLIVGLATVPVLASVYLASQTGSFYTVREETGKLDMYTVKGTPYWHDTKNLMVENGYRVGLYWCETELRDAWKGLSKLDYDGRDLKNQELKYTLIRYLTSMGLRKDAYGISQLKPEDIKLIENGFANCIYKNPKRFSVRIYQTIWEIDQYRKGANPSGQSVIQRLEYLKTGWAIFRDHPLFGVGTGDIKMAFDEKYIQMKSPLDPAWRLMAHNQFLTFLVSFGLVGFILIIIAIVLPVIMEKKDNYYFILMFFLVSLLSMLNEDTLETQAGIAFFTLFYCLFVFADRSSGYETSIPISDKTE
jgi:hypothetical protein